jgi:hypothetical protein
VIDSLTKDYLSQIFNALATNTSVECLNVSFSQEISLNLKDSNSLRFIEKNSTLKTLNLSSITFQINEMTILNETLMKNNSITSLDLSQSNFCGPFDFFQNGTLKKFEFRSIWENYNSIKDVEFLQNLKSSDSLIDLDFSSNLFETINVDKEKFEALLEVLEGHRSITNLTMNYIRKTGLQRLLKNPKLEKLTLEGIVSLIDDFFMALNSNVTLKHLNISYSSFNPTIDWNEIKITNQSLQKFEMTGNNFNFSKNFNLFKELLKIPLLEEFCVKFNKIGKNGVEYLSDFLKYNSTILKLEFNGNL